MNKWQSCRPILRLTILDLSKQQHLELDQYTVSNTTFISSHNKINYAKGTVQLTTFRPLASASAAASAAVTRVESSDTSDYENLSSCTSGRYATLPAQSSQQGVAERHAERAEFSTLRASRAMSTSHGPVFGAFSADQAPVLSGLSSQTLSLQRPHKQRSHWMNQNGRPSDVLARVLYANSERNDDDDANDPPLRSSLRR